MKSITLLSFISYSLWITLILISQGCSEEMSRNLSATPNAFGKANQLFVIADQDLWESEVGDTFRYYFTSAFPLLPQPEPLFDVRHFTPEELKEDPLRKELRTFVLLGDLDDANSSATNLINADIGSEEAIKTADGRNTSTRVARDKWAKGQLLIYMFAHGRQNLIETIKKNFPAATERIHESDRVQLKANVYQAGVSAKMNQEVAKTLGIKMEVPGDYFVALNDSSTIWLRKENEFLSSNIILRKYNYTDQSQLSKEGIRSIRDSLGKKYVSSETDDSYMRINDVDLPIFIKSFEKDGLYIMEARGIWEMAKDFMGGPFISYLMLDKQTNELIFVDCFVYAPGKKKRRFMQELELIAATVEPLKKS